MNTNTNLTRKKKIPFYFPLYPVEIASLTREDGKTKIRILPVEELQKLIKEHEEREAKEEAAKKKEKEK